MDKWQIFKTAIKDLLAEEFNHDSIRRKWKVIKKKTDNYVPNHLLLLFKEIEAKNDKEIKILDHGCGGAMTVFFLVLKGYHNVWGIDISDTDLFKLNSKKINKVLKVITGQSLLKIRTYDGKEIPFKDNFFNIIFSQQVIEHVEEKFLKYYLEEEKRVLNSKGFIFHQIPHRLVPYEGHTKRWFIHWFPKKIYYYLLGKDEAKLKLVKNFLFLKWPWVIKKEFNKYFYNLNNIAHLRLKYDINSKEYSLKEKVLRKLLVFLFNIPCIGKYISKVLSIFFQLEIIGKN
tara:strand:- start:253 stop:1113 length:861 start_codon:yes stop_codon:yes gene_type:complete